MDKPAATMAAPAAAYAARPAEAGLPRDHAAAHAGPDPLTVLSVILTELGECRRILQAALRPRSAESA
jgi:hypothetical protein